VDAMPKVQNFGFLATQQQTLVGPMPHRLIAFVALHCKGIATFLPCKLQWH